MSKNDIIWILGGTSMEENIYVTVTGFANYYGKKPFAIGNVLICEKDPSNKFDSEAIAVKLPIIGKIGFIANGYSNVAGGTMSAGRVYDKVEDKFYVRVMFTTQSKIICRVETGNEQALDEEIHSQLTSQDNWLQKS